MKKEQTLTQAQQTKTLEGGETMKELTQYYPDDRELWWCSRLGNVNLVVYDYEEKSEAEGLMGLVPFVQIHERCNCNELFGSVRHNDGGHYHQIIRVFRITPDVYVVSYENTRDAFYASECRFAVVSVNGEPIGKIVLKEGEWCELLRKDEAEKLINAYNEDEDYTVYYTEQE